MKRIVGFVLFLSIFFHITMRSVTVVSANNDEFEETNINLTITKLYFRTSSLF